MGWLDFLPPQKITRFSGVYIRRSLCRFRGSTAIASLFYVVVDGALAINLLRTARRASLPSTKEPPYPL